MPHSEANPMSVAVELMPCPFCGGPGKIISTMGDWVGQGKGERGGAYGPSRRRVVCAGLYDEPIRDCPGRSCLPDEAQAIAAWNTRATFEQSLGQETERLREALEEYDRKTGECPARKRHLGEKPRPRCRATASEGCGLDGSASYALINILRSTLSEGRSNA